MDERVSHAPPPPADPSPDTADASRLSWLWRALSHVVVAAAAIGVLYAPITWLTGGLRSQAQIDTETIKTQLADIKAGLAVCNSRLDALPRAQDFADWQSHLSRLDAVYDALRDAVTQDRIAARETAVRVQALTSLPATRSGR